MTTRQKSMNLKYFMPLLLSLATVLSAQSDPRLAGGWQVAQVQIPPRPGPPGPGTPLAAAPAAATNAPAAAPGAATNAPAAKPAAAPITPLAAAPAAATNAPAAAPVAATNAQVARPTVPLLPVPPKVPPVRAAGVPPAAVPPPAPAASVPTPASAATNAAPPAKTGEPAEFNYDFPGIPVPQLLEIYQTLVGRTLLYTMTGPSAVPKDAIISLKTESPLTHSEAVIALETVLGMNGITIVPIGDKFAKVVSEVAAGAAGGLISTNTNNMPEAGKMVTQIVQIKYTDVEDLSKVLEPFSKMPKGIIALKSTQTIILRDYAENVDRMVEMIHKIDVASPLLVKPEVINIKYALASDIAQALSALGASGGTSVGKSTTGSSSFGSSRSGFGGNGVGGMGGGMGSGIGSTGLGNTGGYSGMGSTTGASGLGSQATGGRSTFQQNLNRIVQNAAGAGQFQLFGQTKIIADERTNSLLVFANDEDMKMIKDIINKLDVVLAQVLIDAIIMEINLTGTQNTGISYLSQRQGNGYFTGAGGVNNLSSGATSFLNGSSSSVVNGVTNVTSTAGGSTLASLPGGFSYFSKFGNDLNVVMEAVAGDSRANVLSRPRIQTSHAVPADLFIGSTVPYITGTYNYYGGGNNSSYSQLEVGIHLQVLPLINPDGLVVMDIQADVEEITGYTSISGGNVPTTSKRQAGAKVAVRDGETILLGGFISDSRTVTDSGVPGFMKIPLLGNLFRSRGIQKDRTELVMLMRPTVLTNPAIAAVVARQERNKLAGVKAAEREIRLSEAESNAKIDAAMAKDAAARAERLKKHPASTNAPSINVPLPDE